MSEWIITQESLTGYQDNKGLLHSNLTPARRMSLFKKGVRFKLISPFAGEVCSGFMDGEEDSQESILITGKELFGEIRLEID